MAGEIDFRLLSPTGPADIAMSYGRGQQEAQANQLAQMNMRQQNVVTQSAEMNLARIKQEHEALDKLMADITANGGPDDPMKAADMMINSKHPEWFAKGLAMKQSYAQLNNDRISMGLPPLPNAAAPAPAVSTNRVNEPNAAPGVEVYKVNETPATNALTAPVAAPVNALAAPALVEPDKNALMMQAKAKMLSTNPGVRETGKLEMQHLLTTAKAPSAVEEYRFAQTPEGGNYKGTFEAFKVLHAPRTTTNVNVPVNVSTEKKYGEQFASKMADTDIAKMTTAEKAPELAANADRVLDILKQGNVFTGSAADIKLNVARALNVVGASNDDKIANTESLISGLAKNTLGAVKSSGLGSGQGFTDKDLAFLQDAEGGRITLNAQTLQRLAGLSRKAAEGSAAAWNSRVQQMPKSAIEGTGLSTQPVQIPKRTEMPAAIYATNPKTGERIQSTDGGNTWKSAGAR
jgi:hypothetical protein